MRVTTFTATAVLAIAATSIAAGTGYAQPVQMPHSQVQGAVTGESVSGVEHGVSYTTKLAEGANAVTTQLTNGTFKIAKDAKNVNVLNKTGAVVAQVPLTVRVANQEFKLAAMIDQAGNNLKLVPTGAPAGAAKDISAQHRFFTELQRASLGGLVGGIIGFVVGLFFIIGFIPGAVIGAIIGLLVAGGQPLIDAGVAYFSGKP